MAAAFGGGRGGLSVAAPPRLSHTAAARSPASSSSCVVHGRPPLATPIKAKVASANALASALALASVAAFASAVPANSAARRPTVATRAAAAS
eukprot:scaffold32729_cov54-Phaeocystis_antarctica.AAC.3